MARGLWQGHDLDRMTEVHVGTSGYAYKHWRGILYPKGLPERAWFRRYAEVFGTVELNATFYRLPEAETVERWRDEAPDGFLFACKGSRFITHMKRIRDVEEPLRRYFEPVGRLGRKLAVVLWQIPPRMGADPGRLDAFLARLPAGPRYAFEFRHDGWYTAEVCRVLDRHRTAFCEHDLVDRPPPRLTGGFRYLRFHGTTGRYAGRYGPDAMRKVARDLARPAPRGVPAFAYFNNDLGGHAVLDALDLLRALS